MDVAPNELFVIQADEIIENALKKIEANKYRTLIVTDEQLKVLGTVTDGDIRKALLAKRSLLAPIYDVMNTHFLSVQLDQLKKAASIFAEHFYINLIPVVNEKGILVEVLCRDKFPATESAE